MKMTKKGLLIVLSGVVFGIVVLQGLQAAQSKPAPAYVISNIEVTDPAKYQSYADASAVALRPYHATILVRGGKAITFDGRAPHRIIIIKFASLTDAQRWRASQEFQNLRPLQQQSSTYIESFAVEGLE
jgi:uncharacterized protein (DUF1330 family)